MANLDLLGVATSSLRDQCNLLQVISRKLKEKRSEAHPERLIGVATTSSDGVGGRSGSRSAIDHVGVNAEGDANDSSLIIDKVSIVLPRLHRFAREQPSYFKFFYLSLLVDLLKAAETLKASSAPCPLLLNDLFSNENDGNHQHWLCTHSCCLKVFDLIRFIVINKDSWIETAAQLVLEAGIFVRSIVLHQDDKRIVSTLATSKFVDDTVDMDTITAYLIASLSVLNGLLKHIIALPEQQHSSSLHLNVQSIGNVLLETIHRVSTGQFINNLSGNDKELIESLLFITEIELRLKHIMESYPVGTAFHTTCTTLFDHMQQAGLNAISSFILFLRCISFDVNVLCDYLCSPETPALQYLLRMTKIFHQYLSTLKDAHMETDERDERDRSTGGCSVGDLLIGRVSGHTNRSVPRKNMALMQLCTRVSGLYPHETRNLPPPPTQGTIPRDNDDSNGRDADAQRVKIWIGKECSRTVDALPTANDVKIVLDAVTSSNHTSSASATSIASTLLVDQPILDWTNVAPVIQTQSSDIQSQSNGRQTQSNGRQGQSNTVVAIVGGKESSSTPCSLLVNELILYDNIVTFFSGRYPN